VTSSDSDTPKRRARAPKHHRLAGTDEQKTRWSATLARAVDREADAVNAYELRLRRLAASIREDLAAGGIVDVARVLRVHRHCAEHTHAYRVAERLLRDMLDKADRASREAKETPAVAPDPAPRAQPRGSKAARAVAEAERIVREAGQDVSAIDWSRDPASDREGKLRAAMLRVLERRYDEARRDAGSCAASAFLAARRWVSDVQTLSESRVVGQDLRAAIERATANHESALAEYL
jgi:hypothetical protein